MSPAARVACPAQRALHQQRDMHKLACPLLQCGREGVLCRRNTSNIFSAECLIERLIQIEVLVRERKLAMHRNLRFMLDILDRYVL